jgi:oligopeptide/dipeptide ABC transporter ATP-binding protein
MLLTINNLHTEFALDAGTIRAVRGLDLAVPRGETVCLVGESGCGKSIAALSVLRLVPAPGKIVAGSILFEQAGGAVELTQLAENGRAMRGIRGKEIAMIFQEPMTSLSPVHSIGNQIIEVVLLHTPLRGKAAKARVLKVMARVGIPAAARRFGQFPHELSGGLRQRAVIAMALACEPALLIADEPTTALDVTIQAQILALLRDLQREFGMSILLITHDFGVVAEMARQVDVMYLGRVVEQASVARILSSPWHPYTRALLAALPGRAARGVPLQTIPGAVPDPFTQMSGCPFYPRCAVCLAGRCDQGDPPPLLEVADGHWVACHRVNANANNIENT